MREVGVGVVYQGLPGLFLGLAFGLLVRRWMVLGAGPAAGFVAQQVSEGSSGDNDRSVIVIVALATNAFALALGAGSAWILARATGRSSA